MSLKMSYSVGIWESRNSSLSTGPKLIASSFAATIASPSPTPERAWGSCHRVPPDVGQKPIQGGFARYCRWTVAGTVEHWGHIHERTNQYEAVFAVEPVDNAWKVTNIELLDEQ